MFQYPTTAHGGLSPGIIHEKIDLPEPVITHFLKKGLFIKDLPSYEQVEGRSPVIPEEVREDFQYGVFSIPTYPVINKEPSFEQRAETHAKNIMATFTRTKPQSVSKVERTYMLSGLTKPIRIDCKLNRKIAQLAYIKKPSTERIFGMLLYNIVSGNPDSEFLFNCYTSVEKEIQGVHLNKHNAKEIEKKPLFRESLIRLAAVDCFLSINDLERIVGPDKSFDNFLVQYGGNTVAFDFNTLLQPECAAFETPLLDSVQALGIYFAKKDIKEVFNDECLRIRSRIMRNRHTYDGLIKLMDRVSYMTKRIEEKGFKSAKNYFHIAEGWLTQKHNFNL